jgi:two-component system sensor histidine kinase/response regulator
VEGGREALSALTQATDTGIPFPLVLLDAHMPDMDGFAVAAHIQQNPALAGVTILMLSSTDLAGDAARCRELGISLYLTKPIIQSDLWQAITTALQQSAPEDTQDVTVPRLNKQMNQPRWRILLAEDNIVNQTLTVRLLEKHGHLVEVVSTGQEALAALARQSFDLVLMDVQMPELDGFETTAAIRAQERTTGRHLPIIAMTAHAMKGDQERCLAAGMDSYVAKPVKTEELYAAVQQVLKGKVSAVSMPTEPPIDLIAALHTVDGDKDLLSDIAEIFRHDYPRHLEALGEAVSRKDALQIEYTAHSLKGALATLSATTAYSLAAELETMGQTAQLAGASAVIDKLEGELARIVAFFAEPGWQDVG